MFTKEHSKFEATAVQNSQNIPTLYFDDTWKHYTNTYERTVLTTMQYENTAVVLVEYIHESSLLTSQIWEFGCIS